MRSIVVLLTAAACIPPTNNPPPPYGGYGQPQQAQAQRWSCTQIFQCFATCNGDQTCAQGCLANGDANSQAAAMASLQCVAECNTSEDENCITNQCSAQVETCKSTGPVVATAPAYTPAEPAAPAPAQPTSSDRPRQPVSNANILPWLVGDWIGNNFQFQFFADGRVRRSGSAHFYNERNSYQCSLIVNEIGRVTQQGDYLIMHFDAQNTNDCRDRSVAAGFTVTYLIDWKENYSDPTGPLQLILREQNCNRGGTMYCDDPMRRR